MTHASDDRAAVLVTDILQRLGRPGRTLLVGALAGEAIASLLRVGIDARAAVPLEENEAGAGECPSRTVRAALQALPFRDRGFETVAWVDDASALRPDEVAANLGEVQRVTSQNAILVLRRKPGITDQEQPGVQTRSWWERLCFSLGFRKHPAYYVVNQYEALNEEGPWLVTLLEKLPARAAVRFPLAALLAERDLHMDMLRETGERSDAHVVRYLWASSYVRPGDRVLDAACGLGYGSHVLRRSTHAASIKGIDGSAFAIDYANECFADSASRVEFHVGMLPAALAAFENESFDFIACFETLEHVEDPQAVLREFQRLLTPGGRVAVSVPNDWSDESGTDPNPFHLHVYDRDRLKGELRQPFLIESLFAQTASQCKVHSLGGQWHRRPRALKQVAVNDEVPQDCEWWLATAMKSPVGATAPYRERVFDNLVECRHPSLDYAERYVNPWLMHAMMNATHRLRDPAALYALALSVLDQYPEQSHDYAAALCVVGYRILEIEPFGASKAADVIKRIRAITSDEPADLMGIRWRVSLLFLQARLLLAMGELERAKTVFRDCGSHDVRPFGIHLSTKTTEAWYHAGRIAYCLGQREEARRHWQEGIEYGNHLLRATLSEILINRDFPNRFNYGDGVREFAVAWDNIARCANGIHLLKAGVDASLSALDACFQTEYRIVLNALHVARDQTRQQSEDLVQTRRTLEERSLQLETAGEELAARTAELVETRGELVLRTRALESTNAELASRTADLVDTRELLAARTQTLESVHRELADRASEMEQTRASLRERTHVLESVSNDLINRTSELVETRAALAVRDRELEDIRAILTERTSALQSLTSDLVATRTSLQQRTQLLEQANETLIGRTEALNEANALVVERTQRLEATIREVDAHAKYLSDARATLAENAALLERYKTQLDHAEAAPVRFALSVVRGRWFAR